MALSSPCATSPFGISATKLFKFSGSAKLPQAVPSPHILTKADSSFSSTLLTPPASALAQGSPLLSSPTSTYLFSGYVVHPPPEASTAPEDWQGHMAKYPSAQFPGLPVGTTVPLAGGRILQAHLRYSIYGAILASPFSLHAHR